MPSSNLVTTQQGLLDTGYNPVTPAQDETLNILRMMLRVMQSAGNVDGQGRIRITLDNITGSLTLGTLTTVGTVTGVTTVSTVTTVTTVSTLSAITTQPVDQRLEFMERSNLVATQMRGTRIVFG